MRKHLTRAVLVAAVLQAAPAFSAEPAGWLALFNGRDTTGWVQRGGQARFTVEDGTLVGQTVLDTPNSFLCPPGEYADFELEFEVWVDARLNSGVQVRSAARPEYRRGVVHGYQVEIDPSPRAWSGGIYDEERRGWLQSPKDDPAARRAFRVGEWNRYRVRAEGDRIRTWVNEVPISDLVDGVARSGFIGFQVHAAKEAGLAVKWRAIRLRELPRARTGLEPNTLGDEARAEGWRLLFDGHTTWGWHALALAEISPECWQVKDGLLLSLAPSGPQVANADIVSDASYSSFELRAEFRLSPGANSGIKYFLRPDVRADGGVSSVGYEYQLIDDLAADAGEGENGARSLASLYDVLPAAADKPTHPIGEWNEARIIVRGRHVEHWLNGVKVLEFERGSREFREHVARSKHRVWPGYGDEVEGPILLQHHGGGVAFRNVAIRSLERVVLTE